MTDAEIARMDPAASARRLVSWAITIVTLAVVLFLGWLVFVMVKEANKIGALNWSIPVVYAAEKDKPGARSEPVYQKTPAGLDFIQPTGRTKDGVMAEFQAMSIEDLLAWETIWVYEGELAPAQKKCACRDQVLVHVYTTEITPQITAVCRDGDKYRAVELKFKRVSGGWLPVSLREIECSSQNDCTMKVAGVRLTR